MVAEQTILLVDDEHAVRSLAARVLAEDGFTVIEAADGAEALAVCERGDCIALLVTDVRMPGMSGRDLADRVTALRPGLPVLFISGYDDGLVRDLAPPRAFLAKPFSPSTLTERVRELLAL